MVACEMLLMENVEEISEDIFDSIKNAVTFAVENEKLRTDCELCLAISNDEQIRELNRDYRQKDASTDVLSFPANDLSMPLAKALKNGLEPELAESGAVYLGDIVISLDTAKKQAEEYGNELTEELCFLAVHGCLHLLGYDHIEPADEEIMREKQRIAREARKVK